MPGDLNRNIIEEMMQPVEFSVQEGRGAPNSSAPNTLTRNLHNEFHNEPGLITHQVQFKQHYLLKCNSNNVLTMLMLVKTQQVCLIFFRIFYL